MASPKLSFTIILASVPFCFFFFFLMLASEAAISSSSSSSSDVNGGIEVAALDRKKVNLTVYFESLSEPSATFIIKDLAQLFNNDLINIVNLHFVPWANSSFNYTTNTILCQNGPDECELNSLEACVLNVSDDVNKQYALIFCFEFLVIEGRHKKWQSCFSQLGLPMDHFLDCYNTGNGTELGQSYVNETARLSPPHTLLPWVLVNNKPLGKDYANFITYVCKAYKGNSVPAACNLV